MHPQLELAAPGVLVGAFERDNFGDLLFLSQTRKFLKEIPAVAAAPCPADMRSLQGEMVEPLGEVLERPGLRFCWTVGGEVGGTSLADAVRMMDERAQAVRDTHLAWHASPYLPRMSGWSENTEAVAVANSIGVAAISQLTGSRRAQVVGALRELDFLSVRDHKSSRELSLIGVPHYVAPDLVQSIRHTHVPRPSDRGAYVIFQMKAKILQRLGPERVARHLASDPSLHPYDVRLLSAGAAPGHDSITLLEQVADHMMDLGHGSRVSISRSELPWDKVDEIAAAKAFVGTSLHGYIISAAYAVPCVGLEIDKLAKYSSTWGIKAPTGVALQDLEKATSYALSSDAVDPVLADRLADAAARSIGLGAQALESAPARSRPRLSSGKRTERTLRWMERGAERPDRLLRRPRRLRGLASRARGVSLLT